jgi:ABC-type uncharacterized transport system ATPase subunit
MWWRHDAYEMGEVVAEGAASDLARDPRILETYLGQRRSDVPTTSPAP